MASRWRLTCWVRQRAPKQRQSLRARFEPHAERRSVPRPNWFFAFPMPGAFVLELPPVPRFMRRFHPEDVHLTLSFLGGCGEEAALRGLAALVEQLRTTPM